MEHTAELPPAAAVTVIPPLVTAEPPLRRRASARARILAAATEVFGTRGYKNGSLAEIAERVGMTRGNVLHHFGSKDQLLLEVLAYRDQTDIEPYEGHRRPSGRALLSHLLATVRLNATRPGIVQSYAVLSGDSVTEDHPAQEYFRARMTQLRADVAAAYADAAPAGTDPARIAHAASATIAVMDGMQVQWLLDDSIPMPPAVEATMLGLVAWLNDRTEALD